MGYLFNIIGFTGLFFASISVINALIIYPSKPFWHAIYTKVMNSSK